MNDLIKQAEALEANATVAEHAAKSQHADAERWRAEAAKLREQAAREPRYMWRFNYPGGGYEFYSHKVAGGIKYREVRPVRITDEQVTEALYAWGKKYGKRDGTRAVMAYALSLAGVEVEK